MRLFSRICCAGLTLLIVASGIAAAKQIAFSEARGMLSRDYSMAQPVASGATVNADGEYWLTLFDNSGRFIRSENFIITKQPPTTINNYNDYYENVKFALKNFAARIVLTVTDPDAQSYSGDVVKEVCDAYPSLTFGYQQSQIRTTTYPDRTTIEITIVNKFSQSQLVTMRNAVDTQTRRIIKTIARPGLYDYELELAVHDYLVNNSRYDEVNFKNNTIPPVDYTEYGVFVNGVAVCEGYADATARLLGMTGVPTMIISGNGKSGEAHAWNLVKVQNEYCHLDCTYDDPIGAAQELSIVSHEYFNLSDKLIARDHRWLSSDYPRANTMRYSFYNLGHSTRDRNGTIYKKMASQQELQSAIAAALSAHQRTLTVDLMNTDKVGYDLNSAFAQAASTITLNESISCQFLYSDSPMLDVRHVRVTLEYGG